MYLPPHFAESRADRLHALIAAYPLGALVTLGPDGLTANHIPFLLDPAASAHGRLIGHVARNNPVWEDLREAQPEQGEPGQTTAALVIFQGPTAYISPSWYATKHETHEVVPTYNYAVVHVHGVPVIHEDPKWLRGVVGKLTKTMEATQLVPWKMADAPAAFLTDQLTKIVGVEIPIDRIVGKWKTSQNRSSADRTGAISALRATDDPTAAAMADLIAAADEPASR